jgi:hypothetical protein
MKNANLIALVAAVLIATGSIAAVRTNVDVKPVTTINGAHVTDMAPIHVTADITTLAPIEVRPAANDVAAL